MELARTSTLLEEVFPESAVGRLEYLSWLYRDSPFGEVIETNLDDDRGRAGHYALVPVTLSRDGEALRGALSLNTAIAERARGGGAFVRLARDTIDSARGLGVRTIVGVANANSTHGFVRRLDFELLGPLPANVLVPLPGPGRGIRSGWADGFAFSAGGLAAGSAGLLGGPSSGEGRWWTEETLAWRLARPDSRYALHRGDGLLVVSCAQRRRGVTVAVLLKVFAPNRLAPEMRRALVRSVCRFHCAPVALHVGINSKVSFRGVPLPRRIRDSPLNLIYRSLEEPARPAAIVDFEFLDFDAF